MHNGEALGQIFYAPDSIIRSITIWRPAFDVNNGTAMQLYILDTHLSSRDGQPEPDRQALFIGPAIVVGSGEDGEPIRCEFYFDPPLVLPRRGLFAFSVQPYPCWSRFAVLVTDKGNYPAGETWQFGRFDCQAPGLGWPSKVPNRDACFRIEFVNPEVGIPLAPALSQTETCRTQLNWTPVADGVQGATVYRRTLGTDWVALGQVSADTDRHLAFDDTLVTPGKRYGYRLGILDCAHDALFGETWVTAAGGLDLKKADSQPIEGGMRLRWSAVGGQTFAATVYRREYQRDVLVPVDQTWRTVGTIQSDGSGQLAFDDLSALGGAGYDYRLGVVQCGREAYLGRTYGVQVPCTVLPLLSAEASSCQIRLAWLPQDSVRQSITLYRRDAGADWRSVGIPTSDSTGRSHYLDSQVSPGIQYSYRLGVKTPYCNERFSTVVSVSVPGAQVASGNSEATAGYVTLSWSVTGMTSPLATVYRRSWDTDWQALAQVAADDSGNIDYVDNTVAGTDYLGFAYRLGIQQCGQEYYFGELWVSVPYAIPFALGRVQPNPGDKGLTVTFSLPDAAPATFDVIDLAGRRILTREVGELGRGNHTLDLVEGRALPSGVYLIRLTRAGEIRTTRGVIVRQRPGRSGLRR